MLPSPLVFNISDFRASFPQFGNPNSFSDVVLNRYWDWATYYVSNINCGYLRDNARQLALNLMTAHIAQIQVIGAAGEVPGIVTEAAVDKVDVKLEPPPLPNQWQWWLNTTIYGQQLLALLQVKSAGGNFYGGQPVLSAFRY